MDIWSWLDSHTDALRKNGHDRLVQLIDELPSLVADDEHEQVDALYPEALALAKQAGDQWIEIFVRHWFLQSQVLSRENSKGNISLAVELLELSHQPENKDCPQRICAVQDLTNCYGCKDGVGYFEERVAATKEALASIDGSWSCYSCIGAELVSAYEDKGLYEEALEEFDNLQAELSKYPDSESNDRIRSKCWVLIRLGRLDEALELLSKNTPSIDEGERGRRAYREVLGLVLTLKGENEEAIKHRLTRDEVFLAPGYYLAWIETTYHLLKQQAIPFEEHILFDCCTMAYKLQENGNVRDSLHAYCMTFDIAFPQNHLFFARFAIKKSQQLVPMLHKDEGATESILERLEKLPAPHNHRTESIEDIEFTSFNEEAEAYESNAASGDKTPETIMRLARLYSYLRDEQHAELLLKSAHEKQPENEKLEYEYGLTVLEQHGPKKLKSQFPLNLEKETGEQTWYRYWLHIAADNLVNKEDALATCEKFVEHFPDDIPPRIKASKISLELKEFTKALDYLESVDKASDEPDQSILWDMIVCASALELDEKCKNLATRLNISSIDPDYPINEQNLGPIRVKIQEANGLDSILFARRIGPVSARVTSISRMGEPQYYNSTLVFDPAPLNNLDEEDDEGYSCDKDGNYTYLFPSVEIVNHEKYALYDLDGVSPTEEELNTLEKSLEEVNCKLSIRSGETYELNWEADDSPKEAIGVYAYIAIPEDISPLLAHQILTEQTASYDHPLVWPKLLEKLGFVTELKQQIEVSERYNIE